MTAIKVRDAARLLGVSDDTVRRWISAGRLTASTEDGSTSVDGRQLAQLARERASDPTEDDGIARSARNRFAGLVTEVSIDGVMAQVRLQCGPFEVTSLMSAEAARELALQPGSVATAVVKATTVIVETKRAQA